MLQIFNDESGCRKVQILSQRFAFWKFNGKRGNAQDGADGSGWLWCTLKVRQPHAETWMPAELSQTETVTEHGLCPSQVALLRARYLSSAAAEGSAPSSCGERCFSPGRVEWGSGRRAPMPATQGLAQSSPTTCWEQLKNPRWRWWKDQVPAEVPDWNVDRDVGKSKGRPSPSPKVYRSMRHNSKAIHPFIDQVAAEPSLRGEKQEAWQEHAEPSCSSRLSEGGIIKTSLSTRIF